MKKIIALLLLLCVVLSGCSFNKSVNNDTGSNNTQERQATDVVGSEDEDDALNQLEEQLKEQGIAHGMCMAEEV